MKFSMFRKEGWAVVECANYTARPDEIDVGKVFERFYKADLARSTTSSGLGMAIARQLVEQMNGQITADLQENIFSICLQFVCIRS